MTDEAEPPKVPVVNDTRNPAVDLKTPRYLAYAIFAIVALILACLFLKEIPTNNKELLATVVQAAALVEIQLAQERETREWSHWLRTIPQQKEDHARV